MKLLGSYQLPWWDLLVSGTFQSQVPDPVGGANFDYNYFGLPANYVAGNAQIAPSLGRRLSSGGTVTVNVVEPGTLYPGRTNQFDLRVAKRFTTRVGAAAGDAGSLQPVQLEQRAQDERRVRHPTAPRGRGRRRLFQAGCSSSARSCRSK